MLQLAHTFSGCDVYVDEENQYLETRFHDGTFVPAKPNFDEASVELAHELGYDGDTWEMSKDHEMAHTFLCGGFSPTLWWVAHPELERDDKLLRYEEDMVLKWQKWYKNTQKYNAST